MAEPAEQEIDVQIKTAFEAMKSELLKDMPDAATLKAINEHLDTYEAANQEITTKLADIKNAEVAMLEQIEMLEGEVSRKAVNDDDYKKSPEFKALHNLVCKGGERIDAEEKALLRTDSDVAGGYLTTVEMDSQITKKITEISPVRSVARVRTIAAKSLMMPIRTSILQANYEGETGTSDEDTSAYGSETLTPFRLAVTVPITWDMLQDSAFDMESEIFSDASESFAQKEGNKFILGTGVKQPSGFNTDSRVQAAAFDASGSSTYTATDLLTMTGELKTGYNPMWMLNRRELAFIRTFKSTTGSFLWQPGLNGVVANTLAGSPYVIANDMPDQATDAFPIAFADFFRGYTIIDRTGTRFIRDEVTRKKEAIVEFEIMRWNYGQVTLVEAILLMKTPA